MNKNKIIALVVILVVVVLAISFVFKNKTQTVQNQPQPTPQTSVGGQKSQTWQAPPENVTVPEAGQTNVPEGVAVPKNVSPASVVSDAKMRVFEMKIENNKFTPQEFIVKQGDIFDANVTAIDKDYDFTQPDYGFNLSIKKGETKRVQFQATAAGKFIFYCKSCGGPEKGPVGYLVVVPK
jgi:heme/copper-type cytochrome/quinol oxidase subunit 2